MITSNRVGTVVPLADTAILSVLPGLRWHQVDCGTATSGTLAVNIDFGAGERTVDTITFSETDRLPILVFGDVKSIKLVPTSVNVDYTVVYISTEE